MEVLRLDKVGVYCFTLNSKFFSPNQLVYRSLERLTLKSSSDQAEERERSENEKERERENQKEREIEGEIKREKKICVEILVFSLSSISPYLSLFSLLSFSFCFSVYSLILQSLSILLLTNSHLSRQMTLLLGVLYFSK